MSSFFMSLRKEMENSEDFLSLSTPCNNAKRVGLSPTINLPQTMQTQISLISPLLEPYTPLYHNSDNVVGDMHLNAPVTTLSLSTSPMLSPYTASNPNIDNVHPNVHACAILSSHLACSLRKKSKTITPPFPWATNRRATMHTTTNTFCKTRLLRSRGGYMGHDAHESETTMLQKKLGDYYVANFRVNA